VQVGAQTCTRLLAFTGVPWPAEHSDTGIWMSHFETCRNFLNTPFLLCRGPLSVRELAEGLGLSALIAQDLINRKLPSSRLPPINLTRHSHGTGVLLLSVPLAMSKICPTSLAEATDRLLANEDIAQGSNGDEEEEGEQEEEEDEEEEEDSEDESDGYSE
jgi:hypothetical protein